MECYRKTVSDFRKKLRDLGTPYKPIVRSDRLVWARLQAEARQNSGRHPMIVPPELQCASLRQHSFERESPWLRGSATTGPIRVPAVRDRGICVMASAGCRERTSFVAHTLSSDMFDRSIGLMVGASTTQVQIGSPTGPVPDLADLQPPRSRNITRGRSAWRSGRQRPNGQPPATARHSRPPAAPVSWRHSNGLVVTSITSSRSGRFADDRRRPVDSSPAGRLHRSVDGRPPRAGDHAPSDRQPRRSTLAGQDNLDVRSHALRRARSRHRGRLHPRHDH